MGDFPTPARWPELRRQVVRALDAALSQQARNKTGDRLTARSVPWTPAAVTLTLETTANARMWTQQEYWVVDAARGDGRPSDRHPLKFRQFHGRTLTFSVPPETRAALARATAVVVFAYSDLEIMLTKSLLKVVRDTTRAELLEQLFRPDVVMTQVPESPPFRPADRPFNLGQQRAFAAMTSPGGTFVWGPPGTGKTAVITAAIRRALDSGHSVLITSHTHIAVDGVLEGLVEMADAGNGFALHAGDVVRYGNDRAKLSVVVANHSILTLDRAAAVLTSQATRQWELDRRLDQNNNHASRSLLQSTLADAEVDALRQLQTAQQTLGDEARREAASQKYWAAVAEREQAETAELRTEETVTRLAQRAAAARAAGARLPGAQAATAEAKRALDTALEALTAAQSEQTRALCIRDKLREPDRRWWAGVVAGRRRRAAQAANSELAEAITATDLAARRHVAAVEQLHDVRQLELRHRSDLRGADGVEAELRQEQSTAADLRTAVADLRRRCIEYRDAMVELDSRAVDVVAASAVIEDARSSGLLDTQSRITALHDEVGRLDVELEQTDLAKKLLADEVREARNHLLTNAPVIATTLSSLATNRILIDRRFDVVIIDEVAAAEPGLVAYACSRADATVTLVGDFLQNQPIGPPVDEHTAPDPWQSSDIFTIAGIVDRQSAERHGRCVALDTQYRYPSVVADVVNAFAYQGLLQSVRPSTSNDSSLVTIIDTHGHPRQGLVPFGQSWKHPLGLEIVERLFLRGLGPGQTAGFVCPYRPQADAVRDVARRREVKIAAGTAHALQGREYSVVVFDLMVDGPTRWLSAVDVNGDDRERSGARVLNVGLTRTKGELIVITDWTTIAAGTAAGSRALATLEDHPGVRVVSAASVLEPDR